MGVKSLGWPHMECRWLALIHSLMSAFTDKVYYAILVEGLFRRAILLPKKPLYGKLVLIKEYKSEVYNVSIFHHLWPGV
jgi:hypothetical protein